MVKTLGGWLFLLCFSLLACPALACLNDHAATRLDGTWQHSDDASYIMLRPPVGRNLFCWRCLAWQVSASGD